MLSSYSGSVPGGWFLWVRPLVFPAEYPVVGALPMGRLKDIPRRAYLFFIRYFYELGTRSLANECAGPSSSRSGCQRGHRDLRGRRANSNGGQRHVNRRVRGNGVRACSDDQRHNRCWWWGPFASRRASRIHANESRDRPGSRLQAPLLYPCPGYASRSRRGIRRRRTWDNGPNFRVVCLPITTMVILAGVIGENGVRGVGVASPGLCLRVFARAKQGIRAVHVQASARAGLHVVPSPPWRDDLQVAFSVDEMGQVGVVGASNVTCATGNVYQFYLSPVLRSFARYVNSLDKRLAFNFNEGSPYIFLDDHLCG